MNNRRGITSLLIVFIVSIMVMFVVVVWQSRLLMVIHRSQGLADVLVSMYHAESKINDTLSRFLGGMPIAVPGTQTLADGTRITTEVVTGENTENLAITAERQFATNKIQVTRIKTSAPVSNYDRVDIVLGVDCTGSMDRKANPACGGGCSNRVTEARKSVLEFLDQVMALPPEERQKYYIGVETFKIYTKWLAMPTNDLAALRQTVSDELGDSIGASHACQISNPKIPGAGETSLGNATIFVDDYYMSTKDPRRKQIYVLVTDGLPNVSLAEARCGTEDCRSNDGGYCTEQAINYLTCAVADTQTSWSAAGLLGQRDPAVDMYGVTVMSAPNNPGEQLAYDATVGVFSNTAYVKKYFNSTNAENLSDILKNIFEEINKSVYQFKIQKVVPTLDL